MSLQSFLALTLISMSYESKKNAHFKHHLESMSLAGCPSNSIDVNFHLQKVWKFLMSWSKKDKDI